MTRSSSSSLLVRTAFVAAAAAALEGASSFAPPFASPPVCRRGFLVGPPVAAQVVASTTGTTSGLLMSAGAAEAAALGFFSGVRIPAALIAGSSLGALFSLVDRTSRNGGEEEEGGGKAAGADGGRRWEDRLVATYHVLSLVSLLLSLNVVITATAAGSTLLLDVQGSSGASSAFEFLAGEMRYELLTTRWSFFAGLLSFLGAVAARVLVEFDLLASRRRRKFAGVFLLCASSLATHVVSIINGSLYSTTNLAALTVEVIKASYARAVTTRCPLHVASCGFLILALALGASIIAGRDDDDANRVVDDDDENGVEPDVGDASLSYCNGTDQELL